MSLLRSYIVFCLVAMTSFSVTATTLPKVKAGAPVRYIVQVATRFGTLIAAGSRSEWSMGF